MTNRRTDVWKFTPLSYRTSALWDRCPKRGPVQRPYDFQNDVCSKFTQHVTDIDILISSYESESERKKRKEKEETDRPSVNRGKQM